MDMENMGLDEEFGDELSDDIVTLVTEEGDEIDFFVAAVIEHDGKAYGILQPTELMEGMEEDEAFVFEVVETEDGEQGFDLITDDEIIDEVFKKYEAIIENAEN